MALLTFYQIFRLIDDQTLELINRTQVGAAVFEPGSKISKGTIVAGIDFFNYIGNNMEVETEENNTKVIKKIYLS